MPSHLFLDGNNEANATNDPVAINTISNDFEIIAGLRLDDVQGDDNGVCGRFDEYGLYINNGVPSLFWRDTSNVAHVSTAPNLSTLSISDEDDFWLRVTLDADNGASGHTVTWYYSLDVPATATASVAWTQFDQDVIAGVTDLHDPLNDSWIGTTPHNSSYDLAGWVYTVELYAGIGGTAIYNPDYRDASQGWNSQAAGTDDVGNEWDFFQNQAHVRAASGYTFKPPGYSVPFGNQGLSRFITYDRSYVVYIDADDEVHQTASANDWALKNAKVGSGDFGRAVFRRGRTYEITSEEAALLQGAGQTVNEVFG